MSEFVKQSTNIISGVDKVDWLVDCSSSFTSKFELSFPSNTTNIIFIRKPYLDKKNFNKNSKIVLNRKTGYTNFLENLETQSHSSSGGQHGSFDISVKDEAYLV